MLAAIKVSSLASRSQHDSSRSLRHWQSVSIGTLVGTIGWWLAAGNMGVLALEAKFTPAKPRLGETIVVDITATASQAPIDNLNSAVPIAPTVKIGDTTYPAFAIGTNLFRALIPTTPLEKSGTRAVTINDNISSTILNVPVGDRKFPIQRITFSPGKAGLEATTTELKQVATFKATVSPIKLWSGKFIAPNRGRTSSPYGVRRYYNGEFATDYYHRGLDYAGGYGSPIVAPAGGKVVLVGYEKNGFRVHGNVVGLDHGQGVVSIYMHMSKITVSQGQIVKPGEQIGAIGNTGATTGPHLHWGLYVDGLAVDPVQWLTKAIQ